jgi:DNA invertase Pin-like site-specific DNA recombinase
MEHARQTLDAYLRVSRVGGRNGEGFISPQEQDAAITRQIAALGAVRGITVTETDVSGAKPVAKRELEKLVRRVESGESQGIVVFAVDRWSREAADALQAAKRIHDVGGRLVDTKGVDSSTEAGKFMLGLMSLVAEQQRDRLRSGFQAASRNAVERGLHVGAWSPAGYDRIDGRLVPNEDADTIREAFSRRARGDSFRRVAEHLTEAGVQPGGSSSPRWSRSGAQTLIRNRVYLGEVRGQRDSSGTQVVNREAHDPLVTPELFAAANRQGQRALRTGKLENAGLLAGLIRCESCGHKLRRKASGRTTLYACAKHYASGVCSAPAAATIRLVDEHVLRTLEHSSDPLIKAAANAETRHLAARDAVAQAEAELEGFVTAGAAIDPALFRRGYEARTKALEEAQQALYDAPDPGIDPDAFVFTRDGQPAFTYEILGEDIQRDRAYMRRYVQDVTLRSAGGKRGAAAPSIGDRILIRWVGESAAA